MHWHPETGESQVFKDGEAAPEGWLDHHPGDPAKAKTHHAHKELANELAKEPVKVPAGEKVMTKAELSGALKGGGINFPADAKVDELERLLVDGLRTHLTKHKIAFDPADGPRKLLALATPK